MFAFGGDSGSATMWAKEKEKAERADVRSALMLFLAPMGRARVGGMVLVLLIFNGLHDFCFQLFAQFGVVFEQVFGGIAALT